MEDTIKYFSSIGDRVEVSDEILKLISNKITQNPSLKDVFFRNLDAILKTESPFQAFEFEMWLRGLALPFNIQSSLEENKKFLIAKRPISRIEPNSLRVKTASLGIVQFRVPPNTIKKASKAKQSVAQCYVLSETTFYNGMNYIDITFPIFENFFMNKFRKTFLLCTSEEVKKRVEVIASEEIKGPTLEQLKSYGLKDDEALEFYNELQLFTFMIKENGKERKALLADYISIHLFKENRIKLNKVEIVRRKEIDYFTIKEDGKNLGYVDLSIWEPVIIEEKFSLDEPGMDTEFGVYFFDPSTGFDPERLTSSFIVWIGGGKGMVVDPLTNLPQYLDRKRINRHDIEYIFLTHVHSDHDDGVLEQILSGKTIKILTSKIVMKSFINKVEAITGWDEAQIKKLVFFKELEPGKEYKLNDKVSIRIGYGFHSIPTCRFVVTYNDPLKNIKKTISYSGDTNYNTEHIEKLVAEKKISQKRANSILGFIWDSDLIIHDVGGGIHTDIKALLKLPEEVQKKIIAIHISKLPSGTSIRQAHKGEEMVLAVADKVEQYRRLTRQIDEVILFKNLTMDQKLEILKDSQRERFIEGDIILKKGEMAKKFYIIHTGEVKIDRPKSRSVFLGKGDYFGEMAFFNETKTRSATAHAKTDVELLSLSEETFVKYKDEILVTFQNIVETRPLLSKISFFKMLLEREINALSLLFVQKRYKKGEFIIKFGEIGDKFYIVKYGLLNVVVRDKDNKKKNINQIGTGDPFGEIALIERTERTADVIVESDYADIIMIDQKVFNEIVSEYPSIALGLEMIKQTYQEITKERLSYVDM